MNPARSGGDTAEIRLNAFPDRTFKGTLADSSRVPDPSTRKPPKGRIVLGNRSGLLRTGMFAVATFHSRQAPEAPGGDKHFGDAGAHKDWVSAKKERTDSVAGGAKREADPPTDVGRFATE